MLEGKRSKFMKSTTRTEVFLGTPTQRLRAQSRGVRRAACVGVALGAAGLFGCGSVDGRDTAEPGELAEPSETVHSALRDRRRPTAPGNFRVTATTPFSASLAWTPASDDSGNFSYFLTSTAQGAGTVTLPKAATSYVWSAGLAPRNSYTFIIYAKDAAGNASPSVLTSATLPRDTVPPAAPTVSVTGVGSTYVSLAWTAATDDGPFLFYQVWKDGSLLRNVGTNRTAMIFSLSPQTAYTFAVRAYDYGPNYSPLSAPVSVTTNPVNPLDTTAPTKPAKLQAYTFGTGDGETQLIWEPSTDDFDPPNVIRYDVYVNGVLSDTVFGTSGRSLVYGAVGIENQFDVVASDSAGNRAAPATIRIVIQ
jgi:chitinase